MVIGGDERKGGRGRGSGGGRCENVEVSEEGGGVSGVDLNPLMETE